MINTLFFCVSIPIMVWMCGTIGVDTMSAGTVRSPKAAIYAHCSSTSCPSIWEDKSGSSCSLGAVLGRLGYCVRSSDSATDSVVASRIFFGIGNLLSVTR